MRAPIYGIFDKMIMAASSLAQKDLEGEGEREGDGERIIDPVYSE